MKFEYTRYLLRLITIVMNLFFNLGVYLKIVTFVGEGTEWIKDEILVKNTVLIMSVLTLLIETVLIVDINSHFYQDNVRIKIDKHMKKICSCDTCKAHIKSVRKQKYPKIFKNISIVWQFLFVDSETIETYTNSYRAKYHQLMTTMKMCKCSACATRRLKQDVPHNNGVVPREQVEQPGPVPSDSNVVPAVSITPTVPSVPSRRNVDI